jgi:phosphomevalonate kinase
LAILHLSPRRCIFFKTRPYEENFYEFQYDARSLAQIVHANPRCSFGSGYDIASVRWDTAVGDASTTANRSS